MTNFTLNRAVWFQASSVAEFLKYENIKKAIMDHINDHDKILFL